MLINKSFTVYMSLFMLIFSFSCRAADLTNEKSSVEARIESLLKQLTLEEKITLLGGDETGFNGRGIERLGIPAIRMTDGPVGVRQGAATAFPASVNMAASWDTELIYRYGVALGEETLAKGKHCILGPCVGIHRFPLNGRNFESFGEDPFLSSRMAVAYIKGVQSNPVIATVKHFACNDQEWERNNTDSIVDERTLREIHLPAFEYAVKEGQVLAVMSAYNIVNGQHCSENKQLLMDILKKDWNFKGIVISDWVSVYSAVEAANNGLDIEMPQPTWFKDKLMAAIKDGRVLEEVINDKVRRHLYVRFKAGIFDNPSPMENQSVIESDAHKKLALEMAQKSIVLLKNKAMLPLSRDKVKTIALIGPNAKETRWSGGGSSFVWPWRRVSPYDGLKNLLGNDVKIEFAQGVNIDPVKTVTLPKEYLTTPDGKNQGLLGEYFNNMKFEGQPELSRIDANIDFNFKGGRPDPKINADQFSIRWTGKFTPPVTQNYVLAISSDDGSRLYVDDKLIADNWGNHGEQLVSGEITLQAGKAVGLKIEFYEDAGDAMVRLGWKDPKDTSKEPTIEEAVQVAKNADTVILCVGNSMNHESEGSDVKDFKMIGLQDELVTAVTKANPNTVVVVYSGVPVFMKNWLNGTKAVIAALYPGQEGGDALAQILFGQVNPSGKLPFSYIQDRSQSPAFKGYKDPSLKVNYTEGIFVGYRYYDKNRVEPLFPFGHGLSYTSFEYSNLKVNKTGPLAYAVSVDVKNTGSVAGQETVQLYVGQKRCSVERPVKELKGFSKVELNPGQTRTVVIQLDSRAFEFFHPQKNQWTFEPGEFEISAAASSRDIRLKETVTP
jgi:beta-glucosidase